MNFFCSNTGQYTQIQRNDPPASILFFPLRHWKKKASDLINQPSSGQCITDQRIYQTAQIVVTQQQIQVTAKSSKSL